MAEYAFFLQKADQWRKDMALLWGDLSICPLLPWFQLLCHSQVDLSSLNCLKVWRKGQNPHHNITFLLVWVEDAMGDKHYGLSVIWVKPSQVRVTSMEEAVGKLTALGDPRSKDHLLIGGQESQYNQRLYHPRGLSYLFQSHQWGRGPEGLSGWVILKRAWQLLVGPGATSHPRGEQELSWLPLCLSGHPVHQPTGA